MKSNVFSPACAAGEAGSSTPISGRWKRGETPIQPTCSRARIGPTPLEIDGRHVALLGVGPTPDGEPQRLAGRVRDDPLQLFPVADAAAVHGLDPVAGEQPGGRRRQIGKDRSDRRRQQRPLARVVNEVDDQRQQHVEQRPGDHHRVALPERLGGQRPRPVNRRDRLARILAEQADVAAERHQRQPVLGLAVGEAEQAGAEPQRKAQHLDVEQAREDEVPQLVHQDQHAEQHQDGDGPDQQAHDG